MKDLEPDYSKLRKQKLEHLNRDNNFRVACGKSKWTLYRDFNESINLREILPDEAVIEFDSDNTALVAEAVTATKVNLMRDNLDFTIWEHGGKSPHIQIAGLPCSELSKELRKLFKLEFMKHYVPKKYHKIMDKSLAGIHLIRLEWSECWKKKYGIKKLVFQNKKDVTEDNKVKELRKQRLEKALEKKERREFYAERTFNGTVEQYMKEVLCAKTTLPSVKLK